MASIINPPPKESDIKRQKMPYYCKFGKFLTQPVGVSVNAQNDIITVDANYNIKIFFLTNNIFSQAGGMLKHQFQVKRCGLGGGQFLQTLHPSNVAVCKKTGEIIVTECGSSHQVQVYSKHGKFIRRFGANILQQPNAVCVDSMGRFIVVDCKQKWLVIFDQSGNLLKMFGCSEYLQFPNGVATNDKQEIFISDYRAHCIMVFDYGGNFIRQIGGEGITNFPGGVGINTKGEVVVADNHKSFHVTVFSQDGLLLSAVESKVKHAACQGMAVMDDGIVLLASQDLNQGVNLYIYKYEQYQSSQSILRYSTSPFPEFEDQRSYICVSKDERNMAGFLRLPLSPDFTLSPSILRIMFPEATGLYYYSSDNLILGVFQTEEKLFPPTSGDTILYITMKMSNTTQNYFKTANEGSADRKSLFVSPGDCKFSDLKQNVDEMRLTMNQLRREIIELKKEQNDSVLDVNANIFKPAQEDGKGAEEAACSVNETEDEAKDTTSEDAARAPTAEYVTKGNDNRTNTPDQVWKMQGITVTYNLSAKEASKSVFREIKELKEDTLSETEKYRRERIRLRRMSHERGLDQTQSICDMASSQSSLPSAGSSLSGEGLMSLRMLSIDQESVKPLEGAETPLINVQVGHVMGGVKVEPSQLVTRSYKASDDRCCSSTSDKAIDVNANSLPTKARGRIIKILKGVKKPGGMMDQH